MKRAIVASPALASAALAELKDWLGISTPSEDAALSTLLKAAIESCEAFTGTMPIQCDCEEILPVGSDWMKLDTRPVLAITSVAGLVTSGTRTTLAVAAYEIDFAPDGTGQVRVLNPGLADRIVVGFTAGLAASWSALPDGLRHGIVRLAASQYRQREGDHADATPPSAVAALWRPWRRMRLA